MFELEYDDEEVPDFYARIQDESTDPSVRVREPMELFDRYYRPKPPPRVLEAPQAA